MGKMQTCLKIAISYTKIVIRCSPLACSEQHARRRLQIGPSVSGQSDRGPIRFMVAMCPSVVVTVAVGCPK